MKKIVILSAVFLFHIPVSAIAQKTITGNITDAQTGETLPSANILIEGTYSGTITNLDGEYSLQIKKLPATLIVRYIGYETEKRVITTASGEIQNFRLQPVEFELDEITVTGGDPAISIMKEVIRRKQKWRKELNSYKAEAYTRQQLSNDTSIVSVSESISEAYWQKGKGHREVLVSRRQTANIDGSDNFAGVSYLPNFYDDNLDIAGFDVVGVTHPDALSYYDFELVGGEKIDDQIVFELSVKPKKRLQPTFEGTIYVLDDEYALLSVDLKPNRVVNFPPPVQEFDLSYEQQFNSFGGDFWLPVDIRINGVIKVGVVGLRFPPIGFRQVSKITDYQVNIPLPDSLYEDRNLFSVDSTTIDVDPDSMFTRRVDIIPLSKKEQKAYEELDSTATLEKAFRPKGFLTRFIDFDDDDEDRDTQVSSESSGGDNSKVSSSKRRKQKSLRDVLMNNTTPLLKYNRTDALFVGAKRERRFFDRRIKLEARGGYSFGYEEATYGGSVAWWPLSNTRRFVVGAEYLAETETRYKSSLYSNYITSLQALLANEDYYDYYRREGLKVQAAYRLPRQDITGRLIIRNEEHSSINFSTNYDILGRDEVFRVNPAINEGYLRSVTFQFEMPDDNQKSFGIVGAKSLKASVEIADDVFDSDFSFVKYHIELYQHFNTFYKRRLFPNTFDVRVLAGTSTGDLPLQRFGIIDGSYGVFTPFGGFKARRSLPFEGESYLAVNAEHNFRSVPFEILGLHFLADRGISVIGFGGIGKTWISDERESEFFIQNGHRLFDTDGVYSEIGVSLNNIFSILRLDFAHRLDQPGHYAGISVARYF